MTSFKTLFSVIVFLFAGCANNIGTESNLEPIIKDIVVCNVYWEDYKYTSLNGPESAKFVITFNSINPVDTSLIESINVTGPENFTTDFHIQPFNINNLSGYLTEPENNTVWFQTYQKNGFINNGKYTITLTYHSGKTSKKSRVLNYSPDLLDRYKKTNLSFSPSGLLSKPTAENLTLNWLTIPNIDAYYATRVMRLPTDHSNTTIETVMLDNIFGYGEGNPINTGLNKKSVKVPLTLDPNYKYLWFTEILDSNNFNEINIAIFQQSQYFWLYQ